MSCYCGDPGCVSTQLNPCKIRYEIKGALKKTDYNFTDAQWNRLRNHFVGYSKKKAYCKQKFDLKPWECKDTYIAKKQLTTNKEKRKKKWEEQRVNWSGEVEPMCSNCADGGPLGIQTYSEPMKKWLDSNKLKEGDKIPTEEELADAFGRPPAAGGRRRRRKSRKKRRKSRRKSRRKNKSRKRRRRTRRRRR